MEPAQRRAQAAPGALAAFARFVLCGGGVGLASGAAVAGCAAFMPWALANAGVTAASTVLATELHARFTFGGGRSTLRQHVQCAGSAAAAYAVTCTAMAVLHLLVPAPGLLLEQLVYLTASAVAGIGRFAVLRLAVFATGRPGAAAAPKSTPAAQGAQAAGAPALPCPAPATASLWYRTLAAASPLPAVCHAA